MSLPEKVNVMHLVTYDTEKIISEMCDPNNGWINGLTNATPTPNEITNEMIMEYIEGWIEEDFPKISKTDLIIQDENGEEVVWQTI